VGPISKLNIIKKMGCSPANQHNNYVEVKPQREESHRATVSSTQNVNVDAQMFKQINLSLFIIGEENSKYEESHMPSNVGTLLTPQLTDNFRDSK
jgi:hypothetical protein